MVPQVLDAGGAGYIEPGKQRQVLDVFRDGKRATLQNKKPMAADSIFQIMSMTKNFTGVAIMMLVEEGKVDLRRPMTDYLPESIRETARIEEVNDTPVITVV